MDDNNNNTHRFSNQRLFIGIGIILLVTLIIYAYYEYKNYYPSTDDAYVQAPLINIASKINGNITKVHIANLQYVRAGDILLELNPADYRALLQQAEIDLILAKQNALTAKKQMINARANIIKAKSNYDYNNQMAIRYTNLYHNKSGSQETMQKFINDRNIAKQELDQSKIVLEQANLEYEMAQDKIRLADVQLNNAKLTSSYTKLYAPVSGYISDFNLQVGQLVLAGQKLFGLIDNSNWWVDANFKESQLSRIKSLQKATIQLDMYHHTYTGVVERISHASGNTFSLLPSENATGNWVKVSQRFPVRVSIKNDPKFPLRVGASSTVTIKTF